jgi:hypothetical protein
VLSESESFPGRTEGKLHLAKRSKMKGEIKVLSAVMMGDSLFDQRNWEIGLNANPDVIVAQGTSSDTGPTYLATETLYGGSLGIKRGLRAIILPAKRRGIPFIISTGPPAGGNKQLEKVLGWVDELAKEEEVNLRIAVISGELDKDYLKKKIRAGSQIRRLVDIDRLPEYLSEEDIDKSEHIVGQMGPEPIMRALDLGVDGVLTGRALDIALHMALPLKAGFDKGLAAHMAKTIECASLVTVPETSDAVLAVLKKDHFLVSPTNPDSKCTPVSVAAHAFYERSDPSRELNPGGILDLSAARYEPHDHRTVKVSGSRWIPAPYTIKIEGARKVGFRTISVLGVRDERMINQIDWCLEQVRKHVQTHLHPLNPKKDYSLLFRVYGKNGVLGEAEPVKQTKSHELGLIVEAVSPQEEVSENVCELAGRKLLHMDYPGRIATAANVAHPYSPTANKLGPVYSWGIWHLLELEDPCEPFRLEVRGFGPAK